jgi:two-component system, OmpR family, phosphate regulon sensor histidine kinase PhoR
MSDGLVAGSQDHGRNFRRIVYLLVWLVIVPTALLLATGILLLTVVKAELNLVFGILVITFVGCLVAGTVLSLVFLRREATLSKLQLDFVSKVSHELRTPLTSIRLFVETMKATEDPKEMRVCLDVLERETVRLTDRIERLLDWGRMEAGRRIYRREPDNVEAIVREAVAQFDAAHVGRACPVRVEVGSDLPSVEVDRAAMVDALVNLLSNAVKYSPAGSEVVLGAEQVHQAVRLWVRDQGVGIPRREQRNIFEKFYRVDERLSREVEGSGLGLAIVRHVVQAHQGRIEVDSEPGRGSTFTIVLDPVGAESRG